MANVLCHTVLSANFFQDKEPDSLLLFLAGLFVYFNQGQWEAGNDLSVHLHGELSLEGFCQKKPRYMYVSFQFVLQGPQQT